MARRTKQDALETRSLILDAAEQVFQENGVAHTTLNNIADAAGVTRGAIYWHFENKVDLFNQMHERVRLPIESLAEATAHANEPDPLGRLRDLMILVLKETVNNERQRRVLEILFHKCELSYEMGDLAARQEALHLAAYDRTERALNNAIKRRQLPTNLDARKASIGLHAYIRGIITNWLLLPNSFDLTADAESLIDGYLSMLRDASAMHRD